MARVVPVSLAHNPRALWFDPGELEIADQDAVVVQTTRGMEFGRAVGEPFEVDDAQVKALKSPLKPVLRLATDEDEEAAAEMEERGREALPVFKEMAAEANEDMHPVAVEFQLDGDKAVFYFEAEERVDFRELVRKLAARFHVRIDMRQIGVRDEARMVGGLGHCGQELCCKRMGGEFCPVSIRMAKEQDLSLNPQKISGVCGRLMCCLRYEYEAYKDFKQRAPKAGAKVRTPEGESKVVDLDVLRETVKLSREDEKPLSVPLTAFEEPKEGKRPSVVSDEGWEEALADQDHSPHGDALTFITSQFTGTDKLAEAGAVRRTPGSRSRQDKASRRDEGAGSSSRKPRNRRRGGKAGGSAAPDQQAPARKPRRRRSTTISAEGQKQQTVAPDKGSRDGGQRADGGTKRSRPSARKEGGRGNGNGSKGGPRPGQRSSGLRNSGQGQGGSSNGGKRGGAAQGQAAGEGRGQGQGSGKPQGQRRRRRRSHKGGAAGGGSNPAQGGGAAQGGSAGQGRDAQ